VKVIVREAAARDLGSAGCEGVSKKDAYRENNNTSGYRNRNDCEFVLNAQEMQR
jgi:hypothetical protein